MIKRGISPIIATILLIVITLAAAGILWSVISPFITNKLGSLSSCQNVDLTINSDKSCFDSEKGIVSIGLIKGPENITIEKIQFIFSFEERDKTNIQEIPLEANSQKIYYFNLSSFIITYGNPKKVSVAPVILIQGKEKTCQISSSFVLPACSLDASRITPSNFVSSSGQISSEETPTEETGYWVCLGDEDCPPGQKCEGGVCVCAPSCSGKQCGADDGCRGICQTGSCPNTEACVAGSCVSSLCIDKIKNQDETDVDCGGVICPKCAIGKTCSVDSDCLSDYCNPSNLCASVTTRITKVDTKITKIDTKITEATSAPKVTKP